MKYTQLVSSLSMVALTFCSGCLVVSTHKVDVAGNINVSSIVPVAVGTYSSVTQEIHPLNCCVTSGENLMKGKLIPVASFTSQDVIRFYVSVRWDDPTKGAGIHDINYNWYAGDKLVSTFYRRANFIRTPAEMHSTRAAADLGTGHFKAEILIDKKVVGSKEFDILP
jgi:hypothetical protein